ncbi:hypothetical protein ACE6H2_023635 [Prunus campanulata]
MELASDTKKVNKVVVHNTPRISTTIIYKDDCFIFGHPLHNLNKIKSNSSKHETIQTK